MTDLAPRLSLQLFAQNTINSNSSTSGFQDSILSNCVVDRSGALMLENEINRSKDAFTNRKEENSQPEKQNQQQQQQVNENDDDENGPGIEVGGHHSDDDDDRNDKPIVNREQQQQEQKTSDSNNQNVSSLTTTTVVTQRQKPSDNLQRRIVKITTPLQIARELRMLEPHEEDPKHPDRPFKKGK